MNQEQKETIKQLTEAYESGVLNENAYETAVSAILGEPFQVGDRGIGVKGDVEGDLFSGDNNQKITQNIENYYEAAQDDETEIESARRAYLGRLIRLSDQLSLAGVDPKAASNEREAQLNLGAVYTALLTTQFEHGLGLMDYDKGRKRDVRNSAVNQLNKHAHLVILGDPGSGKSSFVNFVAICLAGEWLDRDDLHLNLLTTPLVNDEGELEEERQPWEHGHLIPVRVILRDIAARGLPPIGKKATAEHLWSFLESEPETSEYAPYLIEEIRTHGGLILFDGMDEIPAAAERRGQIKQMIEDVVDTLPEARVLVTSRTYAYQKQDWELTGFAETVLAPFSDGQIRRFIRHWYQHLANRKRMHEDTAKQRMGLLETAVFNSERLRSLAQRPLLITLMASLHAWRGGSLPEKREELYNDTVDLLLDWWEGPKQIVTRDGRTESLLSLAEWLKVDRDKVKELLSELAFEAHKGQPNLVGTADIEQEKLISGLIELSENPDIKPLRLIEYLSDRAGLLLPRGEGVFTFPHRTFQEYLAACHLANTDFIDILTELSCKDPNRWREVVLLAAARAERGFKGVVWQFVDSLCGEPVTMGCDEATQWGAHLAGHLLAEGANVSNLNVANQRKLTRVREGLVYIMRSADLPAIERALASRHVGQLKDPRQEVLEVAGMSFCWIPKGAFWMGENEVPQNKTAELQNLYESQKPQHLVEIEYDYWLGTFPVTNSQYEFFTQAGGYKEERFWPEAAATKQWKDGEVYGYTSHLNKDNEWLWRKRPYDYGMPFQVPNHPVVGITWYEALAYSRWLNEQGEINGWLPKGWEIRLPTEAEWEKGARGGLEVPSIAEMHPLKQLRNPTIQFQENRFPKRRYPWGNDKDLAERCNCNEAEIESNNGVGCFSRGASPYGCEEMSGNVLEWTQTLMGCYDADLSKEKGFTVFEPQFTYPYTLSDGRNDLSKDDLWARVLKGGGWLNEPCQRCAFRFGYLPDGGDYYVGYRLVCVPISLTSDPLRMQGTL